MSERRMFTKKVTDDDNFMSLSSSAQALYLHLSMSADDDGFCNQVNIAMFKAHASVQDLEALLDKSYIIQFDNGVIVIKHWRMANAIRKDRYTPTAFQEQLKQLGIKDNGAYTLNKRDLVANVVPDGCQEVAEWLPQDRLDKDSIDKDRIGKNIELTEKVKKNKYGSLQNVKLTDSEYQRLCNEFGVAITDEAIEFLSNYIKEKSYKTHDHNLTIRRWVIKAVTENRKYNNKSNELQDFYKKIDEWAKK